MTQRSALQNAASVAAMFLTTEAVVAFYFNMLMK